MGTVDNTARVPLGVVGFPAPFNAYAFGSININSGERRSIAFITNSDLQAGYGQYALWNFVFTVCVDSTTIDSNGSFKYAIPYGSGFVSQDPKAKCIVQNWTDWGNSSDTNNSRYNIVRIQNDDSVAHTYYVFYKAYSSLGRAGIS